MEIIDQIRSDWIVLFIPVISAIVGWGTNVVAVKMMFHPLEFVGIKPVFGWQGIVPANAMTLAEKSTDIITTKLIDLRLLFQDFDAESFSGGNLSTALDELVEEIIKETAQKYAPQMWNTLPEDAKNQVRVLVRKEVEATAVQILSDMSKSITDIIDLKTIVMAKAERDKEIMGEMFQRVGSEEFKFIKISGLYFGFLFGIFQMFAWLFWPEWWILPLFGFFVGYVTNFLAIKLIFQPANPLKVGPFTIQGLFHKRQNAVSGEFSTMVAGDILNPTNIVAYMTSGDAGEKLFNIVNKRADELIDRYKENPLAKTMIPEKEWDNIRAEIHGRMKEEMSKEGGFLYIFTGKAINVYSELFDRMTVLDPESFESILRPPFQKDEWKLIIVGAILGLAAGFVQIATMFKDQI